MADNSLKISYKIYLEAEDISTVTDFFYGILCKQSV